MHRTVALAQQSQVFLRRLCIDKAAPLTGRHRLLRELKRGEQKLRHVETPLLAGGIEDLEDLIGETKLLAHDAEA